MSDVFHTPAYASTIHNSVTRPDYHMKNIVQHLSENKHDFLSRADAGNNDGLFQEPITTDYLSFDN